MYWSFDSEATIVLLDCALDATDLTVCFIYNDIIDQSFDLMELQKVFTIRMHMRGWCVAMYNDISQPTDD